MRILLVSPYFPPEVGSAAHLYEDLGLGLMARGHEVAVLTGLPRYHVADPAFKARGRPFRRERHRGLLVFRAFNFEIPWDVPLLRGLDQFFSAFCAAFWGAALPPFDVALVYSPPLPLALAMWGLCRLRRRPLVVNVQDLFPQSAIDLGLVRHPLLIRLFRLLEAFLYRQAQGLMVHSEGNRQHLRAQGVAPGKIGVVPNWVDTEAIKPGPRQNLLRQKLGLNQRFIVSFAGVMGYSQGLETVLESAALLREKPNILFLLVGDGVKKPRLEKLAREHRLQNVRFLPMQSREAYLQVLAASDLCLVTLRGKVRTPVVPSKILSIMAAARPVLASLPLEGDAPRLIAAADCGVCLPPGDPQALTEAILGLYADAARREQLGANGRTFAQRHLSLPASVAQVEALCDQARGLASGRRRTPAA